MNATPCKHTKARLPKEVQLQRMQMIMDNELSELQRQTLTAYYFYHFTIPEIARMRRVHKSSVCRTLRRAEEKIKRFLQY